MRAVDQEIQLLEGMERMRGDPGDHVARKPEAAALPPARQRPMKPIVITKEMLQVLSSVVLCINLHCISILFRGRRGLI